MHLVRRALGVVGQHGAPVHVRRGHRRRWSRVRPDRERPDARSCGTHVAITHGSDSFRDPSRALFPGASLSVGVRDSPRHAVGATRAQLPTGWRPASLATNGTGGATGDSRRKANWEARYQAIIDTSAGVFARGGYHATGITELCVANDLGKGALYHYIGSKEDLLAAIHDRVMDEVMLGADRVAEAGGSPSRAAGHARRRAARRDPPLPRSRLGLPARVPGAHRRTGRAVPPAPPHAYERRVEAVLQAGVDSGEFRDLEPRLTAMAWLGMHNYTYLWLKAGGRALGAGRGEAVRRHLHARHREPDRRFLKILGSRPGRARSASSGRRVAAVDDDAPTRSSSGRPRWPGRSRRRPGRRPCRARGGAARRWRRAPPAAGRRGWPSGTSPGTRS